MPHVFQAAPTGRARCRGCNAQIAKGELRFGERLPNPFGEGEMTLWFHPLCAAYKRPEPLLETLAETDPAIDDRPEVEGADALEQIARIGIEHRRLPRLNGAERAPTGRARCRHCRQLIAKDDWRISLVYYEEGRFEPSGFIHASCAPDYFETRDIMDRLGHFAQLADEELREVERSLPPA